MAQQLPAPASQRLKVLWRKHHWAVVGLWLAFMAGLMGADFYMSLKQSAPLPEARVEVGPIPLPLIAGVNPVEHALSPAPAAGLEETTDDGKLPIVAADGRSPLSVYAFPFDHTEGRPRISIILTDVGPQPSLMNDAIKKLPGSVAMAFNVYTPGVGEQMANTRAAGHETLLMIPADSPNPLSYDPGPGALRSGLSVAENMQRLHLLMAKATGYVGLVLNPQTAILNTSNLATALLDEGHKRGLALFSTSPDFLDMGVAQGSPTAPITLALDGTLDPAAMDEKLAELEQRARESGHVVATSALYPFVITKLAAWLPTLADKGIAIAPPSAAANPIKTVASAPTEEAHGAQASSESPAHEEAPAQHH